MEEQTKIESEDQLDNLLSSPRVQLVEFIRTISSPLLILGGGGKMGPSLAVLARRAAEAAGHRLQIVSVSRFSDPSVSRWLQDHGVGTISLDLMSRDSYHNLPDAENILYLVGLKFGTSANPSLTWATNTLAPSYTCERFPNAKIVALSSGNVYPVSSISGPGSLETDKLEPLGEYSNSCVARERIFEYYSEKNGTPVALIRLSYAVDLRYGVLYDIARNVFNGNRISLANGYLNCIWQGDANEMIIRALGLTSSPAYPINLTGTAWYSVRELALQFGARMGKEVLFDGIEAENALLSNTSRLVEKFGSPPTTMDQMIGWTANWVMAGGRSFNKPTHFEVRDGKY